MTSTTEDRHELLLDIRALIEATGDEGPTFLALVERTLTDGYAHALALEGERRRLERRLGEVTSAIADQGQAPRRLDELSTLSRRLRAADGDLAELRALLVSLRARVDELRAA